MFHVKHEGWSEQGPALGVDIGPRPAAQLDKFERLLLERGAPMGLISPSDVPRVRERHILDSLRAAPFVEGRTTGYDLGSGGGLPGLVLAIVLPELALTLVEVRRNRAAFLEVAVEELQLPNVMVYNRRAETLRERCDLCLARAFAPLGRALLRGAAARRVRRRGSQASLVASPEETRRHSASMTSASPKPVSATSSARCRAP